MSFQSFFDIKKLMTDAQRGLSESDPEIFKVAGLFLLFVVIAISRSVDYLQEI